MRKCLVTGATGFVGRHVVSRLLQLNYDVVAVARRKSHLPESEYLTSLPLDIRDSSAVKSLMQTTRPDTLIHLAWEATPGKFWHAQENFQWISASAELLTAFVEAGGRKAVLAGSCAEYGWGSSVLKENSPLNPTTVYSASKCAFKTVSDVIGKDIDLVWARLFFPYGPEEADSKLISHIIKSLAADKIPEFQSGGRAVDFVHVEDAAAAFVALASSSATGDVNICSGQSWLPSEIAELAARCMGKEDLQKILSEDAAKAEADVRVQGHTGKLFRYIDRETIRPLEAGLRSYLRTWEQSGQST